ncbi:MAG: 3-hydroxyacyl-CoA dehydrogenase NAD-binding domain-containing protein [Anaerolineaceae bacterium]|nr:3-hydroxyacyl-CoA dehydrogenase NAD-binding domain-containing protein [Anaerolineaceae bacterium]
MEKRIGIIGAGMMGAEIALAFAQNGFAVILGDVDLQAAEKGIAMQAALLDKSIKKGRLALPDKERILARITPTGKCSDMADCDAVIEAAFEDFEVKSRIFAELDHVCKAECLFASNTSSIPITKLASAVSSARARQFLGMHFFSPATIMKLVEVIPGLLCEATAVAQAQEVVRAIQKTPIVVKDVAGFAVNRLFNIFNIEAMRLIEEGVASAQDIDTACKLGLGHPMGPIELLDITSLDLNLKIHEVLFNEYGERFRPRPLLRKMVTAGLLGKKAGRGFYQYNP